MTAYLLNLFDLLCTLYALRMGAEELNPLMRCIPIMVAYKVIVVGVLCWWLTKRKEKIALLGLWTCTVVYAALAVYHCAGLFVILTVKG